MSGICCHLTDLKNHGIWLKGHHLEYVHGFLFVFLLALLSFCLFFETVISNSILDHLPVEVHVFNTGHAVTDNVFLQIYPLWSILAGGTAKGIQTALLPLVSRRGLERLMKTPSTILMIPIQSVETRYFSPKDASYTPTFILRSDLSQCKCHSLFVCLSLAGSLAHWPSFSLFQNTFVGLTNLGATCYVNTFLQVWFHNLELRRSLYECNNSRAQEHNTDSGISDTCVFSGLSWTEISTQLLFLTSIFRLWAPVHLWASAVSVCALAEQQQEVHRPLGSGQSSGPGHWPAAGTSPHQTDGRLLSKPRGSHIQSADFFCFQDAQEFSKLFLSLLENTLSKQQNSSLQNVIQRQFCGQFSYVTVWEDCFWLKIVSVGWTYLALGALLPSTTSWISVINNCCATISNVTAPGRVAKRKNHNKKDWSKLGKR